MEVGNILQSLGIGMPPVSPDQYANYQVSPQAQGQTAPQPQQGQGMPQAQPTNAQQVSDTPVPMPQNDPNMANAMQGANAAPPVQQQDQAPTHPRVSWLDTIGRISDVLAKVGGAQALYQPTIDAYQDRAAHQIQVGVDQQYNQQKLTQGNQEIATNNNALVGQAATRLKAIIAAGGNIDTAGPILFKQAGLSDEQSAQLLQQAKTNPGLLDVLATAADKDATKYGMTGSPVMKDGVLKFAQFGSDGTVKYSDPPEGFSLPPQTASVNSGQQIDLYDKHNPTKIIRTVNVEGGPSKGQSAVTDTNGNVVGYKDLPGARLPAVKSAAGAKSDPIGSSQQALRYLSDIGSGFDALHAHNALPGDATSVAGGMFGAIGRSDIGQAIAGQFGEFSAQKRIEINKNIKALQQVAIAGLPASATRSKFEQEIVAQSLPDPYKMSYSTAKNVLGQLMQKYRDIQTRAIAASGTGAPSAPSRVIPTGRTTTVQY